MSLEEAKKKKQGKMKQRYIFRSITLAILLGAIIFALVTNLKEDNEIYRTGDEAPDFELMQVNKNNETELIRLSELEGKGIMLNFWATYCAPCEAEMPFMESLYPEYEDEIEIVAVSLDNTELVIDKFIDKYNLTFPVVHDSSSDVMDLYKVGPIPSTFFINPEGEIVDTVAGALTLEALEDHFKEILPEDSDVEHNTESNVGVGDQAPDFALEQVNESITDKELHLEDYAGKPIVLNFWETSSDLSQEGLSIMESLHNEYDDQVEMIAVNTDAADMEVDDIISEKGLSYPVLRDLEQEVLELYDRTILPSTFFINAEGEIIEVISGELTEETLEIQLKEMVEKEVN